MTTAYDSLNCSSNILKGYSKPQKGLLNSLKKFSLSSPLTFYIALTVITILYVATIRTGHYWVGDDLQYIRHAINLVEGNPYIDPLYINNAISSVSPSAYPPAFPLILTIVYILFGINFFAMKAALIGFFISSLFILKAIFRQYISKITTLVVVLYLGFNPEFWNFKDRILSEFPFLFFSFSALLIMQLNDTNNKSIYTLLLGVGIYISYGIREIALVLPLTLITYELWHYRKITIRSLMAISLFMILVAAQKFLFEITPVHFEFEQQLDLLIGSRTAAPTTFSYINIEPENIIKQGEKYFWSLYRFLQIRHLPFSGYFYLFVNFCVLLGFVNSVRQKIRFTEIYSAGYFCALLLFSGFDGFRYLMPILPFYIMYLFSGFLKFISFFNLSIKYSVTIGLTLIIFVNALGFSEQQSDFTGPTSLSTKHDQLFEFISRHTNKADVVVTKEPRVLSFFTQRAASTYPDQINTPDWFMKYMRAIKAKYLVMSPTLQNPRNKREIGWVLTHHADEVSLVFDNGTFKVYRLRELTDEEKVVGGLK